MVPAITAAVTSALLIINLTLSLKPGLPAVRLCSRCHTPYIGSVSYGGCWRCGWCCSKY